ncbi:MAG: hypothetical protein ABJA66_06045 [Actinomycetota bacterium]
MKYLTLIFIIAFLSLSAFAQTGVPQFKNYPAAEKFSGKNAPLIIGKDEKTFRTRLREAAKEKPNFAGHYILTTWGCGTTCLMGAVIDAKTGKVYWWNFSVCCWEETDENFNPLEFRLNSRLIVFSGLRNEEGDKGAHFYKFENGKFIHLKTIK